MDLRQIMSFMTIYEERTFTRAAERTGIVQPALSKQIKRLEDEFGVPLFERGSRGVVPTSHGKAFYRLCEPIRRDIALARQQMLDLARPDDMAGSIRCGLPPTIFKAVVGPVVADLLARHPHLDFDLHEGFPATVSRWVLDGELDVGIGSWSADLPGLEHSMIYEEEVVLVSGVPLKPNRFAECELADLDGIKLMVSSGRQLLGSVLVDLIGSGRLHPAQTMIVESFLGIMGIARHSDWCAFVPATGVLDDLLDGDLYFYRIKGRPLFLRWHVVHRRGEEMTKANRTFVSHLFDGLRARESRFHAMIAEG
jgi:LysR family transcriptional regulator, nitrogen assimilation regulatory protein